MNDKPKIGVFICKCGQKIDPFIDLSAMKVTVSKTDDVTCCEVLPYPCLEPGMTEIIKSIKEKEVNRLVVAGCESRLMLKKFEKRLESEGLKKGQIDVVNLRGHVAAVSDLSPKEKAEKGARLVNASIAEMRALHPSIQQNVHIEHPPMILGGGVASFTAAQELARKGIECYLSIPETDPDIILQQLYQKYLGERSNYPRLKKIIEDVLKNDRVTILPETEIVSLSGITGDYSAALTVPGELNRKRYQVGTIIACLDGELTAPGPEFGYDGKTVLCQTDLENIIYNAVIPSGQTVFWINDYETGQEEYARLSTRSAWTMSRHILENSKKSQVIILYNQKMSLPLTASERSLSRKLGIIWVPYDKAVQPVIQLGFVSFGGVNDHLEHEIPWDRIVLSPIRKIGGNSMQTAKILGIIHEESEFLGVHHAKVRPEMVGREESYLAGSARYSCDLNEALNQGKQAGKKNAEMYQKSAENTLFAPRVVCIVDTTKCVGCGQCQEICDCGGIGIAEGLGGGIPRVVDPMVCTGGGTCAAACPYQALTLQNNTNDQREARVGELAKQLKNNEFVAFACSWAGLPAADNAGNRGLNYNPDIHIIGIPCVGQIDPSVMARAFVDGAPGLLLVGCDPENCHHSFGVDHAWSRVNILKKLFTLCGFDRRRITMAHADLNHPEDFVKTVESFSKMLKALGPIEKTPDNQKKLESIYKLVKTNSRVRLLLSSGLRRPWEATYRGDQRYALEYDRSDFMDALKEELLKVRLEGIFREESRPFDLDEIISKVVDDQNRIINQLSELVAEGAIERTYKQGKPFYLSAN
ncbi:MAG: hydrogenase iron-sulfur subunit [Proteobacteria bacterium]|nr:hydrogenase iron-sulfur subunit [Pseudomonadota bacterium]